MLTIFLGHQCTLVHPPDNMAAPYKKPGTGDIIQDRA